MNPSTIFTWRYCLCLLFVIVSIHASSQPYVDLIQVRGTYAFRKNNSPATPFQHLWVGSDLPIKLKEKTYLLLSPFFEKWDIDSADKANIFPTVRSIALPIGLILPFKNSNWSITIVPVIRTNGEKLFVQNTFQFGGPVFLSYERKPQQKFRFGVYMNTEFFGLFVVPLLGCDWKIDDNNYLFGLLPGRLT